MYNVFKKYDLLPLAHDNASYRYSWYISRNIFDNLYLQKYLDIYDILW